MLLESDTVLGMETITDLSEDCPLLIASEVSTVLLGDLANNALELSLGHVWFVWYEYSIAMKKPLCRGGVHLVDCLLEEVEVV